MKREHRLLLLKIVSLFSVVRGYNIPIIIVAQYLSAIFIMAPEQRALTILLDPTIFILVFASAIAIASGYIINTFYDSRKDLINRPNKSMLDRLVSQKTKLQVYFSLNFVVAFMALFISWRAFLFFSFYIFLIWLYSHKLKKMVFIGNLSAALLAVWPFFAILLYYYKPTSIEDLERHKDHFAVIFGHASFLFLLILIRELVKDLENLKGDLVNNYHTIPVLYGEDWSKKIGTVLTILTLVPVYILIEMYDVGYMDIYFYSCLIALLFFTTLLWRSNTKEHYIKLHNILKFLIVAGVFCIVLTDPSVLWHGKNWLFRN